MKHTAGPLRCAVHLDDFVVGEPCDTDRPRRSGAVRYQPDLIVGRWQAQERKAGPVR